MKCVKEDAKHPNQPTMRFSSEALANSIFYLGKVFLGFGALCGIEFAESEKLATKRKDACGPDACRQEMRPKTDTSEVATFTNCKLCNCQALRNISPIIFIIVIPGKL